ncbi:unnamed protein product [Effrenium voratum]|nr:unnamed protein product [Effrenium voratum]
MNGKEGTCIDWVPEEGRVHVQLDAGVKALRPKNLKVVRPKQPTNEMLDRVLEVFGSRLAIGLRNGDGVLDINEFARCLAGIGLPLGTHGILLRHPCSGLPHHRLKPRGG